MTFTVAALWLAALWTALGYVVTTGTTDRSRVKAIAGQRAARWWRSRAGRLVCAVAAWPHVLDVLRRVERRRPALTPSSLVAVHGGARLWRYGRAGGDAGEGGGARPPVVLVHSVISTAAVLDLTPETSLVRRLRDDGFDVWLVDWDLDAAAPGTPLEALVRDLDRAVRSVRTAAGTAKVTIVGYCLGATLALLREAAWAPGDPLALIAPVVDTSADTATRRGMGVVLAHPWFHPTLALDERGRVPGPFVRESFHWLRPRGLRTVRRWDAARRDPVTAAPYAAMARWVWEHHSLPGGVLFDLTAMYRQGGLAGGRTWPIEGRPVGLHTVTASTLVVCATRDHIVPTESSTALAAAATAGAVEVLQVPGGHVRMLLGLASEPAHHGPLRTWLRASSTSPHPAVVQ